MLWLFRLGLLLLIGVCFIETKQNSCFPKRKACQNFFSAHKCGILKECMNDWTKYPWFQYRNDTSGDCKNCKLATSLISTTEVSPTLCANIVNKTECMEFLSVLMKLTQVKSSDVLCNLMTACDSHSYLKDLNFGAPLCEDCKRLITDFRNMIEDNATAQALEEQLNKLICSNLPSHLVEYCKSNVKIHVPALLHIISVHVDPESICKLIGLCDQRMSLLNLGDYWIKNQTKCEQQKNKFSWISRPNNKNSFKWTSYNKVNKPSCDDCLSVLSQIRSGLENPENQNQITQIIFKEVCSKMGFFKKPCEELVQHNLPQIINSLLNLDETNLCNLFGMCLKQINSNGEDIQLFHHSNDQSSIPCHFCEILIKETLDLILSNKSEKAIITALDSVCYTLPSDYRKECKEFMEMYGSRIVDAIIKGTAPKIICSTIGLCSLDKNDIQFLLRSVGIDSCTPCQFVIEFILNQIKNNKTVEEIKLLFGQVCSILPSNYASKCSEMVDKFVDEVVKYIEDSNTPEQICELMALCPSKRYRNLQKERNILPIKTKSQPGTITSKIDVCTSCRFFVQLIYSQLRDNKTEAEIRDLLDRGCNVLPSSYSEKCQQMVNRYLDEVIKYIEENYTPEEICELLELCTPKTPLIVRKFTVLFYKSIQKKKPENVTSKIDVCTSCQFFVQLIYSQLRDNKTEAEIRDLLDRGCKLLPSGYSEKCVNLVNKYIVEVITYIEDNYTPEQICEYLELCQPKTPPIVREYAPLLYKPKPIEKRLIQNSYKFTANNPNNVPSCDKCTSVLQQIRTALQEQDVQQKLQTLIDEQICIHLGFLAKPCKEAVQYRFDEVLNLLMKLDLKLACNMFGMCLNQIKSVSQTEERFPVPGVCELCEVIIHKILSIIPPNRSEQAVVKALENVCDLFPSHYKNDCINFVDTYGLQLVRGIVEGMGPKLICSGLGVCNSLPRITAEDKPIKEINLDGCTICKYFVEVIYQHIKEKKTQNEIRTLVYQACQMVPKEYEQECDLLVMQYLDQIFKFINNGYTPEKICELIRLCTNESNRWSLSEQNLCLLGSIFWCRDYKSAELCNAVKYCQQINWSVHQNLYGHHTHPFKTSCDLMKPSDICVNYDMAKYCNIINKCLEINFNEIVKHLNKFKNLSNLDCSICVQLLRRWRLEYNMFKTITTNQELCNEYKDEQLQQCHLVIDRSGILLREAREKRFSIEKICMRQIQCKPTINEKVTNKETTQRQPSEFEKRSCMLGPTYWCSSGTTAKFCNATEFCKHTFWSTIDWTKVESDVDVIPEKQITRTNSETLLGINPCDWGPSYWCISENTARACGTLYHCHTKIWKDKLGKLTNKPNECTRGPAYWCSSFEAAKLCGQKAEWHCHAFVWSNLGKTKSKIELN